MSFPAKCPVCGTLLEFPDHTPIDPVRCPACDSRFKIEGRHIAHLIFTDFYQLLGVNPGATRDELGKAIRAKILEHHPDRNPDDPSATEKLRAIIEAKELLADPDKRQIYNSVYFARPLKKWSQATPGKPAYKSTEKQSTQSGSESQPQAGSTDQRYEEMARKARMRSRQASPEEIDHLVDEIEMIFMQAGVPINLSSKRNERNSNEGLWRVIGTLSFILAGMIYGLLKGSFAGMAIMMILGGIAGWILTSYPGGLVVLAFLVARIFVVGIILGFIAEHAATGSWFPPNIKSLFSIITTGPIIGAVAFGLWGIAISWLNPRSSFTVRYVVHRQAVVGSWVGSLWAILLVMANSMNDNVLFEEIGWWLLLFTIYLFLDVQIFGRPWIFIRERT
jgi:curved DNA-binding protein CbpA